MRDLTAFVNPLDGHLVIPGKVLGYWRDGRPIYHFAGGSGEGDDTGRTDDDPSEGTTDDDKGNDTSGKGPKFDGDFDPERAQRALAAAREDAKKAKADAKAERERVAAILKAAGITPDGKADPEEQVKALTTRAEQAEARAHALATRNAIRDAADTHKANAGELLDSASFLKQLAELDPAADEFDTQVSDLVKKAVKDHPSKYGAKQAQGAGRQGADHTGGSNGRGRSKNLEQALARKLGG